MAGTGQGTGLVLMGTGSTEGSLYDDRTGKDTPYGHFLRCSLIYKEFAKLSLEFEPVRKAVRRMGRLSVLEPPVLGTLLSWRRAVSRHVDGLKTTDAFL